MLVIHANDKMNEQEAIEWHRVVARQDLTLIYISMVSRIKYPCANERVRSLAIPATARAHTQSASFLQSNTVTDQQ